MNGKRVLCLLVGPTRAQIRARSRGQIQKKDCAVNSKNKKNSVRLAGTGDGRGLHDEGAPHRRDGRAFRQQPGHVRFWFYLFNEKIPFQVLHSGQVAIHFERRRKAQIRHRAYHLQKAKGVGPGPRSLRSERRARYFYSFRNSLCLPDGVHMQAMVHQNLLIYRPQKGVVERFEPDFNEYASYATINDRLKTLFEETLVPVLGPVRYTFEHPACPVLKKSVQELEASASAKPREEGIGYCQMWSLFVMEAVLMNPDLDMAAIVEECFRVSNSRPEYLRQMMRGYVQNFSNEMEEIMQLNLKKKGLHPFLITRSDRAKIYNEAFETVAYHTRKHRHPESSSKSSSLSASSAHSEITPDLKHTPLRDLEGLLQVTRGNYDYDKGFRPTRTRRDYARKLKQYLRLQKWPLRKLWDVAAIVWEQARVKMFEKRDEWDKKTEGFIPQLKYAAISTLSKLHAYTQGNYDFNISPNKRVPEMHDAIKQYMQEHDVTVDELWEAAEAEWGKTPALEPLSFN